MNKHPLKYRQTRRSEAQGGYVLILVVITGFILATGALIISERSISSLLRSTKQRQRDEAIEIAEIGSSILLRDLNNDFPYLLSVDCQVENNDTSEDFEVPRCQGWENYDFGDYGGPQSACSNRSSNPSEIMGRLYQPVNNDRGYYRLRNYEFLGDQIQGGTAVIQIQGQRIISSKGQPSIAASAIIEQEVTVTPKCCNRAPFPESLAESFTTCSASAPNFGLLTNDLTLDGGNVLDWIDEDDPNANQAQPEPSQATVHCSGCTSEPEMNGNEQIWPDTQFKNSRITGERSIGIDPNPNSIPPRKWNDNWGDKTAWNLQHNTGMQLTISHNTHPQYCFTDNTKSPIITHCRMLTMKLVSPVVIIEPEQGEIRFYFDDHNSVLEITDSSHIDLRGSFGQISFFGYMTQYQQCSPQKVAISGAGTIGPLFLHIPCALVDLAKDIQLIGAAIVGNWEAEKNSNLLVPPNALQIIKEKYDISLAAEGTTEEFAAVGASRWDLIQK